MDERVGPALSLRIAAFGLPDQGSFAAAVPAPDWPSFLMKVVGQRLTGLAVAATASGGLQLTGAQEEELLSRHREAMLWCLKIERRLVEMASAFRRADIGFAVLKGSALAHAFYPDPSWRAFGDLDILVHPRDWRSACALLPGLGYRRKFREPRPGFVERFGNAAVHRSEEGVEIDLHRSLVLGPFGLWMDPAELFDSMEAFGLGGRLVPRLDDTGVFLHACIHATLGNQPPRLLSLRDVAQVAVAAKIDWDQLTDWARRWRLSSATRVALGTARDRFGTAIPSGAEGIMAMRPSRGERRALEAYTTDRRGRGGHALSTLRAITGFRAKVAYVRALLFPQREFLEARAANGQKPSYLRRWMVPVRWLTGGRRR